MSEFSELIKNLNNVRDYMKDFFIYGYKTRSDFQYKSLRTYDNEKRRIESWLGELIRSDNSKKGKRVFISLNSGQLSRNPLYSAYHSKTFTSNDIHLHFFLLDILQNTEPLTIEGITDKIYEKYDAYFEPQTIRLKLKEYVSEGIIIQTKQGKANIFALSNDNPKSFFQNSDYLLDGVQFLSECAPFGVVGNYILRKMKIQNKTFLMKHNYIVHTLEDVILLPLTAAMEEKRSVEIVNFGKRKCETKILGVPLKVHISTQTGRRYVIIYRQDTKCFHSFRLDYIKSIKLLKIYKDYDVILNMLEKSDNQCWGINLGNSNKPSIEIIKMELYIDEQKEVYILERLRREGRNGTIERIGKNTFRYTAQVFDSNEMLPWIKSFIGRILSLEGTNEVIINKFYRDIIRMKNLYKERGE